MVPTRQIEKRSPSAFSFDENLSCVRVTVGMKRTCRPLRRLNMVAFLSERLSTRRPLIKRYHWPDENVLHHSYKQILTILSQHGPNILPGAMQANSSFGKPFLRVFVQSTAPVTRLIDTKSLLQVTPYHGDKARFLGWKWSFLIAVRATSKPLHEGHKKIEDRISENPDCR